MTEYTSRNFSSRRGVPIDTIVIHHTAGLMPGCVEWLCSPESKVSAHWLIERNGNLHHLVEDRYAAWHSGYRKWNLRSIGIELESARTEIEYTEAQMLALRLLLCGIMAAYKIPIDSIVGHKELAPGRKTDPIFDMDAFRRDLKNKVIA